MNLMTAMFACFLVPALLIAAVFLIVRASRQHGLGRALLIAFGALATAVVALFWFRLSVDREWSDTERNVKYEYPNVVQLEPHTDAPGPATLRQTLPLAEAAPGIDPSAPDFSSELDADTYPSEHSAAAAVTRRVLRSLDLVIPDGAKLDLLVVEEGTPAIAKIVADTARAVLPSVTVIRTYASSPSTMPSAPKEGEVRARLQLDTPALNPGVTEITVSLSGPAGASQVQRVTALDKPWVEAGGCSGPDSGVHLLVVHSDLCPTSEAAQAQARGRAAERLQALVETRLARTNSTPENHADRRWLTGLIRDDLVRRGWVTDGFQQRISRPYAQMWRQSLRLNVADHDLTTLANQYTSDLANRRTGVRSTLLAALGLALGIVVLYLFLNAATKGYYMWPLRLLGIVAVVAGVFLVLKLA